MSTIYTLGYAGWTAAQLDATLARLGACLLDIRAMPYSRRPEWNRNALRFRVPDYEHVPALGNVNYNNGKPIQLAAPHRAVPRVTALLKERPVILMCACRDVETCHRRDAAAFLAGQLGAPIVHLEPPVTTKPGAIKALSLNPPYGSLIAAAAIDAAIGKQIETRGFSVSYRGRIAIHQTTGLGELWRSEATLWQGCLREPFRTALRALDYIHVGQLPRGAVVATCDLVDCVRVHMFNRPDEPELSFGNYCLDAPRYMWKLANIVRVEPAAPARGMPGLWDWMPPEEVKV